MKALEARASCYEKVNEHRKAVIDAHEMITLQPYSPKGYLRLGKVFRLMKHPEDALRIYYKGLKMVSGEECKQSLQRQIDAVHTHLAKQNAVATIDIFQELPCELIERILTLLSRKDRHRLLACNKHTVLFRWSNYIQRNVLMLTNKGPNATNIVKILEQTSPSKIICTSYKGFECLVRHVHLLKGLRALTIEGIHVDQKPCCLYGLQKLKIRNCTGPDVANLLASCPKLKRLVMTKMPREMQLIQSMEQKYPSLRLLSNYSRRHGQFEQRECESHGLVSIGPNVMQLAFSFYNGGPKFFYSSVYHAIIDAPDALETLQAAATSLASLFIAFHVYNVEGLVEKLWIFRNLEELALFDVHLDRISPNRLIELLLNIGDRPKRILALPFLDTLPFVTRQNLVSLFPKVRLIFDRNLTLRLMSQHWQIPKTIG